MIEVIHDIESLSLKTAIKINEFPVFYFENLQNYKISFILIDGAIIPFTLKKNYFLQVCQFLFYPLKFNKRLPETDEKNILEICVNYFKEQRCIDRIIPPSNYVIFKAVPDKSIFCEFGTYDINLEMPVETIWNNIHSKHKNVIRNAEKNNVQISYGKNTLNDFYQLYQKTMIRSNMYCESKNHFSELMDKFSNNIICGVAYVNGNPVGGLFIPYSQYGAYYTHGASADTTIVNGAINYLHWNTMKVLKEKGVLRYDFVGARLSDVSGTKLSGIQQFKYRFGANLEKGFLWKKDLNILRCFIYDKLLLFKTIVKGTIYPLDIIDQERNKLK